MATTLQSNLGPQTPQLWSTRLFAQAQNQTFWHRFEGPDGSGMPIIRKDDLTKSAGDTIKTDMVLALTGAGVAGEAPALEGNEEALKFRQVAVSVAPHAHAVRWSELAEQLINHDMRTAALNQMQKWLAERLDNDKWAELTGGGTAIPAGNEWFAGAATTVDEIVAADYLTLNDISDVKAYFKATIKAEPIRTEGGEEFYGLVVHPYANLALKKDANYQQALREGRERGASNPLFTGATFVWDGIIGYVNNNVPAATNANATPTQYSKNVLFGGQALSTAFAQYPDWRESFFEYGTQAGIATTYIKGEKVNMFDLSAAGDGSGNTCIGHMVLNTAAVAPTA